MWRTYLLGHKGAGRIYLFGFVRWPKNKSVQFFEGSKYELFGAEASCKILSLPGMDRVVGERDIFPVRTRDRNDSESLKLEL